jgi:adenine-specific DNA-methyltransferase
MAKRKAKAKKPIEQYEHKGKKRANNPPVGLVDASTDAAESKKTYAYDPHLDPSLQWAGKVERTSFEIPTVSLHVHERIDPRTILEAVRKRNGTTYEQTSLFSSPDENPPLREAIEFYKHAHNWSNRLIAGDSLLVMNSLLEKEGMAGQVQMVYFDPPYGIKYGSNFQPFINRRDVKDGRDEDLTAEPETVKAFRDTWELGIHSYLSYLRDRLLLAKQLLHESGSIFVQISDENLHHVRELLDEVYGPKRFRSLIGFRTTTGKASAYLDTTTDFILWYTKDDAPKFRRQHIERTYREDYNLRWVEWPNGNRERLDSADEIERALTSGGRVFRPNPLTSQTPSESTTFEYTFAGQRFKPKHGGWKTNIAGMRALEEANRLIAVGNTLCFVRYLDDFPYRPVGNIWDDTRQSGFGDPKIFSVQTAKPVIQRCVLMSSDPGDLVLDITCGSGTSAFVAEQWGRRWITCDTSRVAVTLAKQRLMTGVFDYYQLAHREEGVASGFKYEAIAHVMLKTIANKEAPKQELMPDRPLRDLSRVRVTGPFTVEAVPAPIVMSPGTLSEMNGSHQTETLSPLGSGPSIRQEEWRAELLRSGIRGKRGQLIQFARIEPLPATRWLHADGETKPNEKGASSVREGSAVPGTQRVVVSFGSEFAPLEQRQVEAAIEEARTLVPRPQVVLFAAFQFDPEAAKDIDELNWPAVTVLKAQMNADLLTEDLRKKRSSNESFWLVGQPDVVLRKARKTGAGTGTWEIEVKGFDYYNTKTGQLESGGPGQIAVWILDMDYDGRSLFPGQVFFPMAGEKEGWAKLARNLKAEIDQELIEAFRGTVSLPFRPGKHRRIAVKIVDDRGIESLKILPLP